VRGGELPEGWEWKRLGDVGKIISGVTYKSEEASDEPQENYIPILRATNINGELDFNNLVFVPSERVSKEQFIRADDIVIAMSSGSKAIVGKTAQATKDYHGSFGAFCAVFRCNENIDKKYVGLFFQTSKYRALISHLSRGANINNLRRENFKSMLIPLPPLPVQRQIVAVLEQAEVVRRQRQEADTLTGALLQSVFREMFGDPESNDRGWAIVKLGDASKVVVSYVGQINQYFCEKDGGVPLLNTTNIKPNGLISNDFRYVLREFHEKNKKSQLHPGDIIVARHGKSGSATIIPDYLIEAQSINNVIIKRSTKMEPDYVRFLLNLSIHSQKMLGLKTGTVQKIINTKQLADFKIPLPPLALQQQFARVVAEVERIQEQQTESKKEIDMLLEGLMTGAFSGELVTNEA